MSPITMLQKLWKFQVSTMIHNRDAWALITLFQVQG